MLFTIPEPNIEPLVKAIAQATKYVYYAKNWAGDDSIPPTQDTVSTAIEIMRAMAMCWPIPQLSLSADGEIGLAWYNQCNRVEILCIRKEFLYIGKFDSMYEEGEDLPFIKHDIPPRLALMMDRLYGGPQ